MNVERACGVQARTFGLPEGEDLGFGDLNARVIVSLSFGRLGLFGKEVVMSKDAQETIALTEDARKKFQECVEALAACGFGNDGPPIDTTFAEIEEFGHKVGRMLARAVDETLASQHADQFQGESACPTCGERCRILDAPEIRSIQTTDGNIPIPEPMCHCPVCNRDFFPSANRIED